MRLSEELALKLAMHETRKLNHPPDAVKNIAGSGLMALLVKKAGESDGPDAGVTSPLTPVPPALSGAEKLSPGF